MSERRDASEMTTVEVRDELIAVYHRWDDFMGADIEDRAHGGSPGEWLHERMDELETALKRRGEPLPHVPEPPPKEAP